MSEYRVNCPLCSWCYIEKPVIMTDIIIERTLSPEEYGKRKAAEAMQRIEMALIEHFKGHTFAEWVKTCSNFKAALQWVEELDKTPALLPYASKVARLALAGENWTGITLENEGALQ